MSNSKSKSKVFNKSKLKCFTCHKTIHFKKGYPERGSMSDYVHIEVVLDEYGYECACALMVTSLGRGQDLGYGLW